MKGRVFLGMKGAKPQFCELLTIVKHMSGHSEKVDEARFFTLRTAVRHPSR